MKRGVYALLIVGWLCASSSLAADDATYARVVVESAALRSGPGASFRVVQLARRDDSFRVLGRAPLGHWLELELSDGGSAFVQGGAVWLFGLGEGERPPHERFGIFAPPPLRHARGELAVTFGVLGDSGLLAVRPALLLAPTFALEASFAASVGSTGRLFLVAVGGVVNVFPSWPVTPFFTVGGGAAHAAPNSDAFIFDSGTRSLLYGGGGLRFGFRQRLIVRVEARDYALFEADELVSRQEISGGLSAFF